MTEIGDYVLATKWSDGDPGDDWAVGFLKGKIPKIVADRYDVVDADGKSFRQNGFRRCEKISRKRGEFILSQLKNISLGDRSLWYWKRCSMKLEEGVPS